MIPHHAVDGSGEAVVAIGSLGATLEMWGPQVGPLSERFRLVRFDTRGHGGSTAVQAGQWSVEDLADDVAELMDFVGAPSAHLVGISLGGAIAMTAALRHPGRVRKLALMSTAPKLGTVESWRERAATARAEGCGALADGAMQRWFTPRFRESDPQVVADIRRRFAACDAEGYAACCEALSRWDLRGRLGGVEAETLVVYGTEDEVTTAADAEAIAAEIDRARIEPIEGARHLVPTERADEVNRLLLDFLGE
ncbi:alpha/beta fold hydrolase [Glycomyces xiaoerkulensis]|uniref:alpha/beta fold hydrolase n=1 Tax=Glycomyces xiaoerkulensis TaxID=2038139 RepID=UPI0018E4D661|nr:alpha/beta fold hydrolase [Glycomyces xiaoerkulensis]